MSILTEVIDEKERQAFIDNLCNAYMTIPEIHPEIKLSEDEYYTITKDYDRNITVTVACKKINDETMEIDHVSIIINGTEHVTKFSRLYESLMLCNAAYGENSDDFGDQVKSMCRLEFKLLCCTILPNERYLLMADGHWIKEEKE